MSFGMKCFLREHPLPHRLLLLLNPGNSTPIEDYQLSLPWEIITPKRGLSPLTGYPEGSSPSLSTLGGLSPPLED